MQIPAAEGKKQYKKIISAASRRQRRCWPRPSQLHTCVALLLDLCEGPTAMLTLDEDCVSVVFPPSAADRPEITRPLEKLRFPNSRLSVDEDEETWAEDMHVLLQHWREEHGAPCENPGHLAGALLVLGRLQLRADPAGARQAGNLSGDQHHS